MNRSRPGFRRFLHHLETRIAGQAEKREEKTNAAHMATLSKALGKAPERHQGRAEPMPYRLHIAVAFASMASALFSLYWWYPQ